MLYLGLIVLDLELVELRCASSVLNTITATAINMSDNSGSSNPFARREEFSSQSILLYKISTGLSYIILVVTAFYYAFNKPNEGHGPHHRFWQHQPATPFAQSSIITSIYWYFHLFSTSN